VHVISLLECKQKGNKVPTENKKVLNEGTENKEDKQLENNRKHENNI